MKGNEISTKQLNHNATLWLDKLLNVLTLKGYGKGSVRNYMQESGFLSAA